MQYAEDCERTFYITQIKIFKIVQVTADFAASNSVEWAI